MIRPLPLILCMVLVACRQESPPERNSAALANTVAVAQPPSQCAPPALAIADGDKAFRDAFGESSAALGQTRANFSTAFGRACAKGLLKGKAFIGPKAADQSQLFLLNAPEANVASIYLPEGGANQMVLEYPFLTGDGQTNVPSTDDLEEAIYCSVHGATPEEQESSGRCLVD
ncbi:MAG TPA: hypothetical protein VK485_06930 [Sphingomicrobium sp.]|nr:hypothetical protein [Sphingomicrobium sp.]